MNHLRCPLCKQPFYINPQGIACAKRHQFDRAKEGYFNLLPVQQKQSQEPGDAKEQLQARRRFLEAGFFSPLTQRLLALVSRDDKTLLDLGCGEGHFTRAMAGELSEYAQVYGVDIAKAGVQLASKSSTRSKSCFVVASNFDVPLADASLDVITRILAPSKDSELRRLIAPHGRLIIVAPAENHLIALRQRIYASVQTHEPPKVPEGFECVATERIGGDLILDEPAMVEALLAMTPFAWRMPKSLREQFSAQGLRDQLDFVLYTYRLLP